MNKLLILAAFAVVASAANVDAAGRATRAQAAKDPSHPVTMANAEAKKAGRKTASAEDVAAVAEKKAVKALEAEKGRFARAKAWAGDHKKEIAIGAGATVVAGLIVDAIVRKDKSLVMRLVNLVKGTKAEKPVLAEVQAQLSQVAAR